MKFLDFSRLFKQDFVKVILTEIQMMDIRKILNLKIDFSRLFKQDVPKIFKSFPKRKVSFSKQ